MTAAIVLVHSPLVGSASWQPIAAVLGHRGHEVWVPDLTATIAQGAPYFRHQVAAIAAQAPAGDAVLVGHSGAGSLLPAAGAAVDRVESYVFVDAGLPSPGKSWLETAPADLGDELRRMAQDGWLPPWPEWWGPEALAEHLPAAEARAEFTAGCPPLPMAMFEEAQPAVTGWPDAPCAYLQLSEAYHEPAARARGLGWPVLALDSHHLGIFTDPELVASALSDLLDRLRRTG
jgi:hypothetical protein